MAETWLATAEVSTSGGSLGAMYTPALLTRRERKAAVVVDTHPVLEAMDIDKTQSDASVEDHT
ncbi:hypothetical protein SARC_01705 [Sphaeroforma arctica JP610]|uniref:Uncharacterized protein n=1 Tax=Sphaeroforma arctica JP610 TaxID=667725 RepID=A0A0L0GB73_9EUKA|nr:hypothetical protein SARC_01705 [Sphaeroforma arctica JP610]KNC86136.1 hypothetical protein SARC_01705 [Sphaeroforma arctica JP610]|eukprot:XP_014160038.1 hypothetical protein SARC_01705 [Sphaeroforma arctica JP610]